MERSDARKLVVDLLEEEALTIGGLIAVHDVEDEFVWRLFRSLDAARRKALRQLAKNDTAGARRRLRPRPHPAIEEFLANLRRA